MISKHPRENGLPHITSRPPAPPMKAPKPDQPDEPPKQPVGRPLKFKTVAELDMAIQLYFDKQDPHVEEHMVATGINTNGETMFDTRKVLTDQKPYTSAGLARAMGIDRKTLLNYKNRDEFFPSVQAAIDRLEEYSEAQLFGPYANGAKFSLNNNFQGKFQPWTDKQVLAGDKDAPLMPVSLDAAILNRMTNKQDGETPPSPNEDSPESSQV